ncbi:glycosyltransferase [Ktedonospora formicarum]|uniref:Glycosyl transferase n=1 Tax=Ktedonospora formicarum TaxID=2778364 RepID=A0A8J3HZD9_9CHLR|nr:glycosyltransferase family 2 protein [Ktedonospora formicarum]GHO46544.1 glycosyl transferase [Ktedonospora formicarum]
MKAYLWKLLICAQTLLALRVILRLLYTSKGVRIESQDAEHAVDECVTILVPVLNEYKRLTFCLEGLLAQGREVAEIIVIDGGSIDGTRELVASFAHRDVRLRLVDASPIPSGWNGKVWGLQVGWQAIWDQPDWVLTIDADVRPRPLLVSSMLGFARKEHLDALSVATRQELGSAGEGLLHPSLLTTLVYRFGAPGRCFRDVDEVQANGQCFLFRREVLEVSDGFSVNETCHSLSEDVTLARLMVRAGHAIGFYETDDLVSVRMYDDWREMWKNWTRSLSLSDHQSPQQSLLSWLEVTLVQALPLPLLITLLLVRVRSRLALALNGILAAMRLGVLIGTARAYPLRPWSYWFSPLCDLPVAFQLARMALRREHIWRGRKVVRKGSV